MKILIFCRGKYESDWRRVTSLCHDEFDLSFAFYGKRDSQPINIRFYKAYAERRLSSLSKSEIDDVVTRCRILREIDRERAERLAHAAGVAVEAELENVSPGLILGALVDEYYCHVCSVLAEKRGILFVGLAGSFFSGNGAAFAYSDGTPYRMEIPEKELAEKYVDKLKNKDFLQNYTQAAKYTFFTHFKKVVRFRIVSCVFALLKLVQRDWLNVHYCAYPYLAHRRRLSDFVTSESYSSLDELEKGEGKYKLYLPLPFMPEATSNYWIKSFSKIARFDEFVSTLANELGDDFLIVCKEHPHAKGCQERSYYSRIRESSNVVLLDGETSNEVVDSCHAILVGGGSLGLQGILWDIPVITFCFSSYWYDETVVTPFDLEDQKSWKDTLITAIEQRKELAYEDKVEFVRRCLSSCYELNTIVSWYSDPKDFLRVLRKIAATATSS